MKLLVPVNSLAATIKQIEAGANEVYLGGDTNLFNRFSFNGRGRFTAKNYKISPDFEEIKAIVQYAHQHQVTVMFCANIPFVADDLDEHHNYLGEFYKHVEAAVEIGVDSVIVGDIGAIQFLREQGITVHITASTFLETVNRDQILFLKELGANRVVLDYQMVLSEIEELASYNDLELEVFGHYGCSFYSDCNMKHSFGESDHLNMGIPCRNFYQLIQGTKTTPKAPYLNAALTCSLCSVPRLKRAGIYALKLVGRDYQTSENIQLTTIYSKIIKMTADIEKQSLSTDEGGDYVKNMVLSILPEWWIRIICNKGLCKYLDNQVTQSYIGL
ncbi:MAG TPA: peptidase U32 family protein [Bacillota bacterium]